MEQTKCIFKSTQAECTGPRRTNLSMVACKTHLKDHFGLEMGHHEDDHPTNVAWVGGFLRPVKNISYFKRNTVILPTKEFFDRTQRPEEYDDLKADFRKYQMNPIIIDYIRDYGLHAGKSFDRRFVIEMYRNFMCDNKNVDPGPKQKTQMQDLTAVLRSRISMSESNIQDQSIFNHLKDFSIYVGGQLKRITDLNLSIIMMYILTNFLYSEMQITPDEEEFTDLLPYNCEYVDNIGVVATELINHPHFLVINGVGKGSPVFYNSIVSLVKKEVVRKKYTLKDVPSQYALTTALKSGSYC